MVLTLTPNGVILMSYSTIWCCEDDFDEAVKKEIKGLADGTVVDKVIISSDETELYVVRFDAEVDEESTANEKENIIATRKGEDFQAELEEWVAASEFSVVDAAWSKISINDSNVYLNFHPEDVQ